MSTRLFDPARQATRDADGNGIYRPDLTPYAAPRGESWSISQRVAFRFAFAYLVLYNLPFPLSLPPFGGPVERWYGKVWQLVVPWVGAHVLHLARPITVLPNGSGDTTFNYVQLLVFVVIAAIAAIVWTLMDHSRREYRRLHQGLRVYIRYALAIPMLSYGAFKVIKSQFPDPSLDRLIESYGDFSPMGVIWAWMGTSYAYNLFAGLAEMTCGLLLFFRRTTTLGALLTMAVMGNVVMVNFAFDVPVKLYSSNLLLMAVFLLVPDVRRLFDAFFRNRAMPPADLGTYSVRPVLRAGRLVTKSAVVLAGIGAPLWMSWNASRRFADDAPRPALFGIWDVQTVVRGRDTIPPLLGDTTRWRRFVVSYPGRMTIRLMNDSVRAYRMRADTVKHTVELTSLADSTRLIRFSYVNDGDRLRFDGPIGADTVHMSLRRVDHTKFRLLSRGFHWINEFPFNR